MSHLVLADRKTGEIAFDGKRVSRSLPCPICSHLHRTQSWCLVDTARGLAICPRVESARRIGDAGYLHRMDGGQLEPTRIVVRERTRPDIADLGWLQPRLEDALTSAKAAELSDRWGTSIATLHAIGCGWDGSAWTFPMHHGTKIVGYRRRLPDGGKVCRTGSRLGLMRRLETPAARGSLFIVEGESDLAAALDLGLDAVARPGCRVCEDLVVPIAKGRDTVIVADSDRPGLEGAKALRARVLKIARSVVIVRPPGRHKDLRDWVRAGGSREALRFIVTSVRGF